MRRNAVSQWELSDHFWAESDPPEPRVAARNFLQKCARKFDRLTTDRRVKYTLTGHSLPVEPQKSMDRVDGGRGGRGRRISDSYNNAIIVIDDDDQSVTKLPLPLPPCVIKRADDHYAFATVFGGTDSFKNFPYHKVSTTD